MTVPILFNLVRFKATTTGTGTIGIGAAVLGFLTPAQASIANNTIIPYGIRDQTNSETGYGTYNSVAQTLTRNVRASTAGGGPISISSSAEITITPSTEDLITPGGTQTLSNKTIDNTNAATLLDGSFTLQNTADPTKQLVLSLAGIGAGTKKMLSVSNSGTLAGGDGYTLAIAANKTLTVSNTGTLQGGDAFVLSIAAAKTATFSNTLTFSGTDGKSLVLTNGLTIMTNDGTLAFGAASKTLTVNNSITIAGTDGKTLTLTNGLTVTTNDGTLAFGAASKTFTVNNSLTLAGTDATTMTFPAASDTIGGLGTSQTWTAQNIYNVARTIASGASAPVDDLKIQAATTTYSGNTHITTAVGKVSLYQPTLSAASALTVDNAATLYIDNAPVGAGAGPLTITNAWSLLVNAGATKLQATTINAALTYGGVTLSNAVTGTGNMVLATGPTLSAPVLGTPASGTLTNCTGLPLSGLAAQAAWTFLFNNTSGSASPTANTIDGLTNKASPAAGDEIIIWDVAGSAIKKATVSSISSAGSVSSIAGNTGAFTLGAGLTNSTNVLLVDATYVRGYLGGLTLSNDGGTPNSIIDVAAGVCCSDDFTTLMKTAAITKSTAGTWVVGSGSNGLDAGTIAATTWYHVFIIERTDTGVVDALISTSATSPTMPTNYTKKRRIGSFLTDGSSHIIAFSQFGNEFLWSTPILDVNISNLSTTPTLETLTVPLGVVVSARLRGYMTNASVNTQVLINSPSEASTAAESPDGNFTANEMVTTVASPYAIDVRTNTSSQIRVVSTAASTSLRVVTYGWIDARGMFA